MESCPALDPPSLVVAQLGLDATLNFPYEFCIQYSALDDFYESMSIVFSIVLKMEKIAVKGTKMTDFCRLVTIMLGSLAVVITSSGVTSVNAQTAVPLARIIAQSPIPVTYVTKIDNNQIVMQITEGEFRFHGYLKRTSGNTFVGQDEQVRVIYDRSIAHIVVINVKTGTEYYNYVFSDVDEGAL
jgi:hypothetical protein